MPFVPGRLPHSVVGLSTLAFHCRGYKPGAPLGFRMGIFGFMGGFGEDDATSKNAEGR